MRVVYCATAPENSYGHVVRGISLCRHIPEATMVVRPWHAHLCQSEGVQHVISADKHTLELVESLNPDTFVMDHMPAGHGNEFRRLPACKTVLIHRSPKPDHSMVQQYDYTIDIENNLILIRDYHELLNRNGARKKLGFTETQRLIVVPAQSSGGIIAYRLAALGISFTEINYYPFIEVMQAADVVVAGAGWNMQNEVTGLGVPHILLPLGMDDQTMRATSTWQTIAQDIENFPYIKWQPREYHNEAQAVAEKILAL